MSSELAASLRREYPVRKPMAFELAVDPEQTPSVRQAFGTDVVRSKLSPRAQLGYRVLVDHINRGRGPQRPYDGRVFLTDETFGVEVGGVSKRQVQRIRSELLAGNWICLPKGDAGGRGNATIWYHLHPDGQPCPLAGATVLKQRSASVHANERRAAARQRHDRALLAKDDNAANLSGASTAGKDDMSVIVWGKRMTESPRKDDENHVKDDESEAPHKEEPLQELIPEPETTTTRHPEEFPSEFARLMDQEVQLDDGALRRLWRESRAILPDASAEEIHLFFRQRAPTVYRNRKLDNPTGLMLSTVRDWFSKRRVLSRRSQMRQDEEELAAMKHQLEELCGASFLATGLADSALFVPTQAREKQIASHRLP